MMLNRRYLLRSRLALLETFHRWSSKPRGLQHSQKEITYSRRVACSGGAAYIRGDQHGRGEQD